MNKKTILTAFKASLPVLAGYLVLGIGFGVLLEKQGYGFLWAALMSFTVYGGSMQYASINLIANGAGLIATALMTLMIQVRHFFYGISMLGKYQDAGKVKPYLIFALTDETYSLVCTGAPEGTSAKAYYFFVSLLNQIYWVTGSAIGGLLGAILPFDSKGMDFAMTALFVVIFVEQWQTARSHIPALLGLGITLACLLLFGAERFLIPSMILITLALAACRSVLEVKMA